jgi:hypothetical protein
VILLLVLLDVAVSLAMVGAVLVLHGLFLLGA